MIRVCSGFSPAGRKLYGDRFLATFDRYWPAEIELRVYVEEQMAMPRDAMRILWSIRGATRCRKNYADPLYQGRVPTENWKQSAIAAGYNFRLDASKFWKQMLIPQAASLDMADGDILIWLDGDVESIKPVPSGLIESLVDKHDVAFFGRGAKHSEIGFWAVRLAPLTRDFLAEIADWYIDATVLALKEWHSAFVWDHCRRSLDLDGRNLCPPGAHGHVWPLTPLARYTRHDKGKRKPGMKRG